jgi:PAS domain S-box-containing protein
MRSPALETGFLRVEVSRHGLWDFSLASGEGYLTPGFRRFLGYSDDDRASIRRGGFELIHPDDRESAERCLREHIDGLTEEYEARVRLRKKDGQYLHVLTRGKVIGRDSSGRPLRMMGIHLDLAALAPPDEAS